MGRWFCGAASLALLVLCPRAPGNLVVNGSFEDPPGQRFFAFRQTFPGWLVVGDGGVKVGDFWQVPDGTQGIDLCGTQGGAIQQFIGTTVGQRYLLTFASAGNPGGDPPVKVLYFRVGDGDVQSFSVDTAGRSASDMGWISHAYPFIADADSTELFFGSGTLASFGPTLDDVHVNAVPSGDANEDLRVNFSDLLVLAQNYGSATATWNTGDFDGDGAVTFSDLLTLAQHYGTDASDPRGAAVAAVPEPVHLVPAVAIGAFAIRLRRMRGTR
jgi:hypothetical protein